MNSRRAARARPDAIPAPTILIFLKAPRLGRVKTRLALEIGDSRALQIYRQLVARQLAALPAGWPVEIHYAPRGARAAMRRWLGARWTLRMQGAGDLGRRLSQAVSGALARGARGVLAIGGDCPTLDARCLQTAAGALAQYDVVLGPARDGGYYLIGMRRPLPGLFEDIPWSSSLVFPATRQRIRELGLRCACLERKEDVDDRPSLRRNARWLPRSRITSR